MDASQQAFVESTASDIRLLAPAGCGKTLSLLHRCLSLSTRSKSARPRFLVVTFTVAAKAELLARMQDDPTFAAVKDQIVVSTLNSFGYTRIKNTVSSHKLISSKDEYHFTMLNQLRPVWMKYENIKEVLEGKKKNSVPKKLLQVMDAFKSIGYDHFRIDNQEKFLERTADLRAQGLGTRLEELVEELTKLGIFQLKKTKKGEEIAHASDREIYSQFFQFWREATGQLIQSATFTLEDQKYFAYLDERGKLHNKQYLSGAAAFDHVLVDEFQDINPLDLALIKAVIERNRASLTIVGDDDQAIYEWRGATPEYILHPEKFFEREFATHILETNYRSPRNIVQQAKALIEFNQNRVQKNFSAFKTEDAVIETIETKTLREGLDVVLKEVKEAISNEQNPSRVAIIGRKKSQLIPYQIFLASNDIPFCAAEDLQVFLSKAFERLLELLMIKAKADVPELRMQIVENTLKFCDLIKRYPLAKADREGLKRYLIDSKCTTVRQAADALGKYAGTLKGSSNGQMSKEFSDAIVEYLTANSVSDALVTMSQHFEGLQIDVGKAEDDIFFVDPPFAYLAEYAESYGTDFNKFINDVELAREQLVYVPPMDDDQDSVTELFKRPIQLMTALRAKGKEFDSVILLGVNDGIWPSKYADTVAKKEAERRVFYVAFTRAKRKVIFLVSTQIGQKVAHASPYLDELNGNQAQVLD
jgi:DNA helicase-2/ATP-dependent DNA helicase PcrA